MLRLHPETVQRALTDQDLGLILPPTLQISFQPIDSTANSGQMAPTQLGSTQDFAPQPQSSGEGSQSQQQPQLSSSPSQQLSQHSDQQSSQQLNRQPAEQAWGESGQGQGQAGHSPEWRRLSGGPEGAGFGGNRGSIWAMVATVGHLVPLNMQVHATSLCNRRLV